MSERDEMRKIFGFHPRLDPYRDRKGTPMSTDPVTDERLASLRATYEKMSFERSYAELASIIRELQASRRSAPQTGEVGDRDRGTCTMLLGTAMRVKDRMDNMVQRDGSVEAAITGKGMSISYLLAKDIVDGLTEAADMLTRLSALPGRGMETKD